jgi:hypothetical protein
VSENFPGHDQRKWYKQALVIFEDVIRSERTVWEYATLEAKEFKTKYTIVDESFAASDKEIFSFAFSGPSYDPFAWIESEILAASVRVVEGIEGA